LPPQHIPGQYPLSQYMRLWLRFVQRAPITHCTWQN